MEGVSDEEDLVVEKKKTRKSSSQGTKASQGSKPSSQGSKESAQAKGKGEGKVKK